MTNSGRFIDSCGRCGGNNCDCFQLDSIFPTRGPRTGGTEITLRGAGFFLNDSTLLNFTFDSEIENCGAPYRFPLTQASVPITCLFIASENQQLQAFAIPVNQSTIRCITEGTTQFDTHIPQFSVQVRIADGPFSNAVTYIYDDYSSVDIQGPFPRDAEISTTQTVTFTGNGFISTSAAACFIDGLGQCFINATAASPFIAPATFLSSSQVSCDLPKAEVPCRVTVQLSVDGQASGLLNSVLTDFEFTYRFSAPIIEDVYFLSDLANLVVQFDRSVQLVDNLELSCERVFDQETLGLIGGTEAQCYWSDNTQQAINVAMPTSASVEVASSISLKNDVIVSRGELYSYAIEDGFIDVNSERNVIQPVAILSGPDSIPACGQVSFQGSHSLFPGYRGFQYTWSVAVEDSQAENYTNIVAYLNSLLQDSFLVTFDANWFLTGVDYYLQLSVVNSVGLRSETESILLMKEPSLSPQAFIDGSTRRELYSGEDIAVQSRVTRPDCSTLIGPFEFEIEWQLFRITDQRRGTTAEVDLSSVRTQSSEIIAPSSVFNQDGEYQLQITVTETSLEFSATATVEISVLPVDIAAQISGGNRTVSQAREIVLDARLSQTNPTLPPASYTWICSVLGSFNACYNRSAPELIPTPIAIASSNFATIPGRDLEGGLTYNFTILLQQAGFTSSASVLISLMPFKPPIVEIRQLEETVQTSAPLVLEGLVYSQLPIESVYWESVQRPGFEIVDLADSSVVRGQFVYPSFNGSQLALEEYSSIPLVAMVTTNQSSRANLILQANALISGASYVFRLSASSTEGETSFAEVTVTPNLPPHSASLSVSPSNGVTLETEFTLAVENAQDTSGDSPFTYQFGFLLPLLPPSQNGAGFSNQASAITEESIQWLSGVQATSWLRTILPSGVANSNHTVTVFARIIDRQGGYSDVVTRVTVLQDPAAIDESYYLSAVSQIRDGFLRYKDWNIALARLVATLKEVNKLQQFEQQNVKQESLRLLQDIFTNHLPPASPHYVLVASLLSEITTNNGVPDQQDQTAITDVLRAILEWFQQESSVVPSILGTVPTQSTEEPLYLQSGVSPVTKELSPSSAFEILSPWVNLLEGESSEDTAQTLVRAVDSILQIFCQESATGEDATSLTTTIVDLYIKKAVPIGPFNVSNTLVDFSTALLDAYREQACTSDGIPCAEVCVASSLYVTDILGSSGGGTAIELDPATQEQLREEIEGSDPGGVELFSDVLSLAIPIPSSNSFLEVQNLNNPFQIFIPLKGSIPDDSSQLLCLFREVGGGRGIENSEWRIDSFESPRGVVIDSTSYFICEFNHLSEFAIGLLPPPIITQPPVTTMATTPTTESETTPTTPSTASTMATTPEPTQSPPPVIAIAVAIIIIVIFVVVIVVLLVVFCVWWKKRNRKLKIGPMKDADTDTESQKPAKLVRAGPLTPEESKVPMNIIQCLENGERTEVGKMNVLPSIRLRELRYQLADNFEAFKNKPFYFLTRQLCDIEPPEEQQRFVSLVYENKAIFVREVTVANELTRKHFCFCGNAAQFECSTCSAQGYCSPECQLKHWTDQHQRECGRLSEKRNRSDILLRRQTTVGSAPFASPMAESPRRVTIATTPSGLKSPTSPVDWKSFLNTSRQFQQQQQSQPQGRSLSVPSQAVSNHTNEEEGQTMSPVFPVSPRASQTAPKVTLGQLAGRPSFSPSSTQDPSEAPVAPTTPLRPLVKLPSAGAYSLKRKQLPPIASRSLSVQYPPGHHPQAAGTLPPVHLQHPASAQPQNATASPSGLASPERDTQDPFDNGAHTAQPESDMIPSPYDQGPSQAAFYSRGRSQPRGLFSPRDSLNFPHGSLSVQSVGSEELAYSLLNMSRDVRNEPLLESDEDEYESSYTGSEDGDSQTRTNSSVTQAKMDSRPPSLAARKQRSSANQPLPPPRRNSRPSPLSSGSSSSSSSETGSSDTTQTPSPSLPRAEGGSNQAQKKTTTKTADESIPPSSQAEAQTAPSMLPLPEHVSAPSEDENTVPPLVEAGSSVTEQLDTASGTQVEQPSIATDGPPDSQDVKDNATI